MLVKLSIVPMMKSLGVFDNVERGEVNVPEFPDERNHNTRMQHVAS